MLSMEQQMGHLCLSTLFLEWYFPVDINKERILADDCFWREFMQRSKQSPACKANYIQLMDLGDQI